MTRLSKGNGQQAIGLVLRYGSLVSTLIMALGLSLALLRGPVWSFSAQHRIRPRVLLLNVIHFDPAALTEFGVLLLLFTPIFRILVAVVAFALERDRKYVLISLGVLAIVLLSIGFAVKG